MFFLLIISFQINIHLINRHLKMKCTIANLMIIMLFGCFTQGFSTEKFIKLHKTNKTMTLVDSTTVTPIFIDDEIDAGINRAVNNLVNDIKSVSDQVPLVIKGKKHPNQPMLIIGNVQTSSLIADLAKRAKLNLAGLIGKIEKFHIQTISDPFPGVEQAMVIAGSDKRGTIYGIYELSKQIGVSPWYFWADVPIVKQRNLYVEKGVYTDGEPCVRYRGVFLNDEAPSLSGWSKVTYGGFNSKFYEKVFELLLRLKANYMWPAMWGNAFYDDDLANGDLANEMGIVMGTSHHEPMAMAQQDWHRFVKRNELSNLWNYNKNSDALKKSWQYGIERSKSWEKIVTVGMRGDGDEAMEEGTNIALLEKIVKDQRNIIEQVTGVKAESTPQVWALYKEVQDYYDHGMRVPDDITLLFCDDNWGNVRKLPELNASPRKGGYGMYYHFDYVGAPRNSKWINISPIQRVWEQMNLTYSHGVKQLWIVNVGDLKPMEYPISFFLDMAWNPTQFNPTNLIEHTEKWCGEQFGQQYAKESARIIDLYSKYNRRVTPEMLNDKTFSLENYNEFERVVADYKSLAHEAMQIYYTIPGMYKDAFDQLVVFPTNACSNLYEMYFAVAKNKLYAAQQDTLANYWAEKAKYHFKQDSILSMHYNSQISNGKWVHMMDQVRVGYSSWQEPRNRIMPKLTYVNSNDTVYDESVFLERNGYVSIEAEHFNRKVESERIKWHVVPGMGKTLSSIITMPQNAYPKKDENIYVEYDIKFESEGEFDVQLILSPTLNFNANKGLRYEISLDNAKPQVVNFNGEYKGELGQWQAEHIIKSITKHKIDRKGKHTLRYRILDAGIVLQKILINTGSLKHSYLGPPESEIKSVLDANLGDR